MASAAKTIVYFGMYLTGAGIGFMIIPNLILRVLSLPETQEPWIRVTGLVVCILGYYYQQIGHHGTYALYRSTIVGRISAFGFFLGLTLLGWIPPVLLIFGGIDLIGATWTWAALRREKG